MAVFGDEAAAEVAAMQFAGGMAVAEVAERWERDTAWVEAAVRQALLKHIPQRDGGLKMSRMEVRAVRSEERTAAREMQGNLEFVA